MADNWETIGNLAERLHNAPMPVKHAYNAFIATSDTTFESEETIKLLSSLLRDAFKLDFNSRSMVGIRLQQLDFQTLAPSTSTPPPEEVFKEPDSGMTIIIERPKPKQEPKPVQEVPSPVIKKKLEEVYADNIKPICKTYEKDYDNALKVINEHYNRPFTMICEHANKCKRGKYCWFAHSKKEQDDANNAYINTLKEYYADNPKYMEFINGFIGLFGKDWKEYGVMLLSHKNGYIPKNDKKFFEDNFEVFREIQFVKQPEED